MTNYIVREFTVLLILLLTTYLIVVRFFQLVDSILLQVMLNLFLHDRMCLLISTSHATRCRNPPRMARFTSRLPRSPRSTLVVSRHPSSRPSRRAPNPRRPTLQLRRLNRKRRVSVSLSSFCRKNMKITCSPVIMSC